MLTLGVLISGSGTNLQAILDRIADRRLDAHLAVVVSNRPGVGGLARAERAGVPTLVVDHRAFAGREAFEAAVVDGLGAVGVDTVALAGFDRLVTGVLLAAFPGRVLNIHPALLPAFKGLHAQRQALEYGVSVTGATVHFVDEHLDHGPIILQGAVPVQPDDTEETLRYRILEVEHAIYPQALQLLAENRLVVEGRRVRILGEPPAIPSLLPAWPPA